MTGNFLRDSIGRVNWADGSLSGPGVQESTKTLGMLPGVFRDSAEWARMDPETVVYRVQWISPANSSTEGELIWGNSTIEPGRVGEEYFMTHGHFHARSDRGEFYATIRGTGLLVLMDHNRKCWAEPMSPGSIHYVNANIAHRAVNVGNEPLRFVACWPSDAGHDYASIISSGFGLSVICSNEAPQLVVSQPR